MRRRRYGEEERKEEGEGEGVNGQLEVSFHPSVSNNSP